MKDILLEIQNILREKSSEKNKESIQKFVPTSEKVYGVKIPELNKIAQKYKNKRFKIIEELWNSGAFEERLLASKILGKVCSQNPEKTIKLIKNFSKQITNWAVCDTLATQGIRGITKQKEKEIFSFSKQLIKSESQWQRRFAIVLLTNYTEDKNLKNKIKEIIKPLEKDNNHYIKKAMKWIEREIK